MARVNQLVISGNLGGDPEVVTAQSGVVIANFTMAHERRFKAKSGDWESETDWHRVTAFGYAAEAIRDNFNKGNAVTVVGSIRIEKYTNSAGEEKTVTKIIADSVSKDVFASSNGQSKYKTRTEEEDDMPI